MRALSLALGDRDSSSPTSSKEEKKISVIVGNTVTLPKHLESAPWAGRISVKFWCSEN